MTLLRVLVGGSIGRSLIAPALPRFRQQHPALQVHLVDRAQESRTDDCTAAIRIGVVPDSEAVVQEVGWIRTVTCAAPGFLAVKGTPRLPQDLAPHDCVAVIDAHTSIAQSWVFEGKGTRHVLVPRAPLAFSDPESAVAAAVRGAGFVRLPSIDVDQPVAAGLLQPVLEEWNVRVPVSITVSRDRECHDLMHALTALIAGLIPRSTASAETLV
jgi:LysR family transcriptional regulator, regulator for bpeEF and oprC